MSSSWPNPCASRSLTLNGSARKRGRCGFAWSVRRIRMGRALPAERPALFSVLALFTPLGMHVNAGVLEVIFDAKSSRQMAGPTGRPTSGNRAGLLAMFSERPRVLLASHATLISRNGSELTSNYIVHALKQDTRCPSRLCRWPTFDAWLASRKTPVLLIARSRTEASWKALHGARRDHSTPFTGLLERPISRSTGY